MQGSTQHATHAAEALPSTATLPVGAVTLSGSFQRSTVSIAVRAAGSALAKARRLLAATCLQRRAAKRDRGGHATCDRSRQSPPAAATALACRHSRPTPRPSVLQATLPPSFRMPFNPKAVHVMPVSSSFRAPQTADTSFGERLPVVHACCSSRRRPPPAWGLASACTSVPACFDTHPVPTAVVGGGDHWCFV